MNIEISLRNLEHTESIDHKIKVKLSKIQKKHFSENSRLVWTSWLEKDHHISTLHASDGGKEYFAKASADNLYKTIDQIVQKIESQISTLRH